MLIVTNANPLLLDPSRTKTLRRTMTADITRRMKQARRHVLNALEAPDWLGRSKQEKITEIRRRVREAGRVLVGDSKQYFLRPWYERGLQRAREQGVIRAFVEGKQRFESEEQRFGAQRLFVREVGRFYREGHELAMDKARHDIEAIADHLMSAVSREVTEAVRHDGDVRQAVKEVYRKAISQRAVNFVKVNIVSSHAEGQLDGWEHLGETMVGVRAEWNVRRDENGHIVKSVCPKCRKMDKRQFTIKQARGKIPLHVGCLCAWRLIKKRGR